MDKSKLMIDNYIERFLSGREYTASCFVNCVGAIDNTIAALL